MSNPPDNAPEQKGFVYVLSTKAMPHLLKIGFSLKHPNIRAQELSGSGMPHPYRVEYCAFLNNPYDTEQAVHNALADKHEAKEFFRISAEEAILAISAVVRDMGFTILYEEGDLKSRELAKEQANREALALAEARRKKWWLKMPPPMALYMRHSEPLVEAVESLASRIRFFDVYKDQDLSFIFTVLKRLRMPQGFVLDWGYFPDARSFPLVCFFSRREQEHRPETTSAYFVLPEQQRTFPFGLQVIAPPPDLADKKLPWETIRGFVELAIFDVLRYAFVERHAYVVCGESTPKLAISKDRYISKAEIEQAMRLDLAPRVTISYDGDIPRVEVQFVIYAHGVGLTRTSRLFSLDPPVRTFRGRSEPLLRLEHQKGFVFVNPSFIVQN
jgi:hypothetical protein